MPQNPLPPQVSSAPLPAPVGGREEELARREFRLFRWAMLLALALGCAWPLALNLVDPDLWGHVRYAQDWLAEGELPRTATHTFTAVDHPWINHENLSELVLAFGAEHLGGSGMLLAKCLAGMAVVLSMVWVATRRGANPWIAWLWMLVVTTNLQPFFLLRPQLLSFLLCAVTLVLLDRAFGDWQDRRVIRWSLVWCLPVVVAVWVNTHGGFLAGMAIIGAYLGGRMLELMITRTAIRWSQVAMLAPGGAGLPGGDVCESLRAGPAPLVGRFAHPTASGNHRVASPASQRPGLLAVVGAADPGGCELAGDRASAGLGRSRDPAAGGLAIGPASAARGLCCVAVRLLDCPPPAIRPRTVASLENPREKFLGAPGCGGVRVVALLGAIAMQSLALDERLRELPVDRGRYPVDALQFMADRQLEGKLVASFNWSQYALSALAPRVQLAFDGRYDTCYPTEVVDMHFDFLLGEAGGQRWRGPDSGPVDGTRVLKFGEPDLVLIDRLYDHPRAIMQAEAERDEPRWVLLYRDRVAELWGRSYRYDDPTSADYLPLALRVQDPRPREGSVPWPALPERSETTQVASESSPANVTDAQL